MNTYLCTLLVLLFGVQRTGFDDIRLAAANPKAEYFIVLHMAPGECVNCVSSFRELLRCIQRDSKKRLTLSVVGVIRGTRPVDVSIFKREYAWQYGVLLDTGQLSQQLGLSPRTRLSVWSSRGQLLLSRTDEEFLNSDQCAAVLKAFH